MAISPKEKAEDLIDRYLQDAKYKFGFREVRKECALIAVDEILNNADVIWGWDAPPKVGFIKYWQEVKQEIEKL